MLRACSLIALLLASLASLARADDATARARAALALAEAEANVNPSNDPREIGTVEEAKRIARETLKPVLVRSGSLDCSALCTGLETVGVVCHASRESESKFTVIVYSPSERCYYYHEWKALPSRGEIVEQTRRVKAAAQPTLDWML